jgi:hypothetical protein
MFGDFSPIQGQFTIIPWLIYLVMIIFMMIIMFNMLVAIAGETYNNFMENSESVANGILSIVIYELETFFIWNRCRKGQD